MKYTDNKNYDPIYGKVMGMSNAGWSTDDIATALHVSKIRVLDIVQTAFGRTKLYSNKGEA